MMATYYYNGTNHYNEVVAHGGSEYKDFKEFRAAVDAWLRANDIDTIYDGEQTHHDRNGNSYKYFFRCIREEQATLAALRWA